MYPALIASNIINESVTSASPIAVVSHDVALLEKSAAESAVGVQFEGEEPVYGAPLVLNKLVESFPDLLTSRKSPAAILEQEWVNFSFNRFTSDFKAISAALGELNDHLTLRSFLVGYTLTIADIAVWGYLSGHNQAISILRKNNLPNLVRWFRYIGAFGRVAKAVDAFKEEVNSKKKAKSKESNFEIGLLDTEKGVVTRFPPEPSGYLHIGHAKAALLNQYFAQAYKGKLIIRFDDTNPSKEKLEYQARGLFIV